MRGGISARVTIVRIYMKVSLKLQVPCRMQFGWIPDWRCFGGAEASKSVWFKRLSGV